jgi:hypothetical protein
MADEVIERVVDGPRPLLGLGQPVQVGQDLGASLAEVLIELATRAPLPQVQGPSPPGEEARGIGTGFRPARIREVIEPAVAWGEEVAGGLDQGPAGDQGRPALRFWSRARARSSATES